MAKKKLRAIDLYSGVGGWSLGLRLAGIEVVTSYERSGSANETNFKNTGHLAQTVDIRGLSLSELPKNIDIVVGSPPCTEFSFSNRGGDGDITEGLKDIVKFLTIVDHLRPEVWAMENVPRVASILDRELKPKGRLAKFRHLGLEHHIVHMEDFGLPQRRRRCIAGRFDHALLQSYAAGLASPTLGSIVEALSAPAVKDPLYGLRTPQSRLQDHVVEDFLNEEEQRINHAAKQLHPIYNAMAFPDPLEKTVRTITATCTRVSRESIVISTSSNPKRYRRLTIRERASLQGFPITFQFYGNSYGEKLRMVGNAVPPLVSYYLAHAFKGTPRLEIESPVKAAKALTAPTPAPKKTIPDSQGSSYSWARRFRFAIPSLRLKSGVRFEMRNGFTGDAVNWEMGFVFGSSKSIHEIDLSKEQPSQLLRSIPQITVAQVNRVLSSTAQWLNLADVAHFQDIWSHRGPSALHPFDLLDHIDARGRELIRFIDVFPEEAKKVVSRVIDAEFGKQAGNLAGLGKLEKHAPLILSGILLGFTVNTALRWHGRQLPPQRRNHAARKVMSERSI